MRAIIGPTYIKALTIIETPSSEGIVLSFEREDIELIFTSYYIQRRKPKQSACTSVR